MIIVIEDNTILGPLSAEGLAEWQQGKPIPKNQSRELACNLCMTLLGGREECDKCHNVKWRHVQYTTFGKYPDQGHVCLPCYQVGLAIDSFARALNKEYKNETLVG